ncbi:glycosyl hydrolase-related protein [Paenibacillus sp. R14(2021)]|uniref:glycosyl hydrolase-related protein n=1 Tax=Paenibacillus sp. R14(2021) TaxID=2859228 RepID=UPI001C614E52|nr:glycosyl hydrolase-related protein [Paenibacillus sp. R14(2021)]
MPGGVRLSSSAADQPNRAARRQACASAEPAESEQHGALSNLKVNVDRGDWIARWYNLSGESAELSMSAEGFVHGSAYASNVLEEVGAPLPWGAGPPSNRP